MPEKNENKHTPIDDGEHAQLEKKPVAKGNPGLLTKIKNYTRSKIRKHLRKDDPNIYPFY